MLKQLGKVFLEVNFRQLLLIIKICKLHNNPLKTSEVKKKSKRAKLTTSVNHSRLRKCMRVLAITSLATTFETRPHRGYFFTSTERMRI